MPALQVPPTKLRNEESDITLLFHDAAPANGDLMSKGILGVTALALLVSAFSLNTPVFAQNGGEARSNERASQKKLDDRELTPIRPIRRVGEDSWPAAHNQPVRETTGQPAKEPAVETKKEDTAQNAPKPESKPGTTNSSLGNQSPPPDRPEAKQDHNQDHNKDHNKDHKQAAAPGTDENNAKGFASIRLGTDESGRVAVNEAQQRQIAKAIRKQHVDNVKVSVGSVAPANVRLVAVSSSLVDVLPQFRDDSMFVTGDGIVIVEPSGRKVIALVPVKPVATASREERRPPARTAARERGVTVGQSSGERFPTREEILAAPVTRSPAGTAVTRTYRSYQYEPDDDDVVIIERRRPRIFGFW
jgi:hypothetical protein